MEYVQFACKYVACKQLRYHYRVKSDTAAERTRADGEALPALCRILASSSFFLLNVEPQDLQLHDRLHQSHPNCAPHRMLWKESQRGAGSVVPGATFL